MRAILLLIVLAATASAEHCEFPQGSNDGWAKTDLTLAAKTWTIDYDIRFGAAYLVIESQDGQAISGSELGGALGARGKGSFTVKAGGPITVRWLMVPGSNMTPEQRVWGTVTVDWSMH